MKSSSAFAILLAIPMISAAAASDRTLFEFNQPESVRQWQTVNDGVMGGRSQGRVRINNYKNLEFTGNLSLQNNGGFASVRARGRQLALQPGEMIVARVRGDGREYNFDVYSNNSRFSFRQPFKTKKNQWIEVQFPWDKFTATWRGRRFPNQTLSPGQVTGLGFLLGDKKTGPFQLEVEWVKTRRSN